MKRSIYFFFLSLITLTPFLFPLRKPQPQSSSRTNTITPLNITPTTLDEIPKENKEEQSKIWKTAKNIGKLVGETSIKACVYLFAYHTYQKYNG